MADLLALATVSAAKSRAITAENPDGSRAGGARATEGAGADAARELGQGWKVSPACSSPRGPR